MPTQKLPEQHFREVEKLLRKVSADNIAQWLMTKGYFPERYVLPPSFEVQSFALQQQPYFNCTKKIDWVPTLTISYPKTPLTDRTFSIQHPKYYHDLVFHIKNEWETVVNHLFHQEIKIFSYSCPIPVEENEIVFLSPLRAGRMIYEWLEMAERNLIAEAYSYKFMVKADITNFYNSIYTHSIAWALTSNRQDALDDKIKCNLLGTKIDKLVQCANDGKTHGIPVGSAISDLIAEIILARIDLETSRRIDDLEFIGMRFKDDYRFLCKNEEDANKILRQLSAQLNEYNLSLNETKTQILKLPDGLFRKHVLEYQSHSLLNYKEISLRRFKHSAVAAIEIHRRFPGTSILEKFLNELFDHNRKLKIIFDKGLPKENEIQTLFSFLMLVKRESLKTLCYVLAIIEEIILDDNLGVRKETLIAIISKVIDSELKNAAQDQSSFELSWYVWFCKRHSLDIPVSIAPANGEDFLNSILLSQQSFFTDCTDINLFKQPEDSHNRLSQHLAVFDRNHED